jgi:alginate O-acetyltransferase complex protein AlgI
VNFVSYEFIYFMACILAVYYVLPHRLQNLYLLAASYIFYGWWDVRFLALLFGSSILDYCSALVIGRERERGQFKSRPCRLAMAVSLTGNLGMLCVFKYFNFFIDSMQALITRMGWEVDPWHVSLILPVGISFYTFQTLSYVIDVYRGRLKPVSSVLDFLLYVSLFPQLVAGPIERAVNLVPQVIKPRHVTLAMFYSGAQLALVGFIKKLVIADNMALIVDRAFSTSGAGGSTVLLGTYAFALQIYCDFSGYCDIACGVARMLGFNLSRNFHLPYFSTSPSEFWKRWHISLSSWLRDYLYIPLGGNRYGLWLTYRNLMLTMILGGLWHGASWTFVIWGTVHGAILVVFHALSGKGQATTNIEAPRGGVRHWLSVVVFFHLTCLTWLIFRARDVAQLTDALKAIFSPSLFVLPNPLDACHFLLFCLPFLLFEFWQYRAGKPEPWRHWNFVTRTAFYVGAAYALLIFGAPHPNAFIYFQF